MAQEYRFSPGGSVDQRRNLYEALLEAGRFSPETVDRDRMLQEEFGPPEVFMAESETMVAAPESTADAMQIYMENIQNDISGIMPLDAPTGEEYQKAGRSIARKERFWDRGFQKSDEAGFARMDQALGEDIPMDTEQEVVIPEDDPNLNAVSARTTLVRPEGDEPSLLAQEIFGSKTSEQIAEEKRLKDPKPALDAQADEMGEGDDIDPEGMAQTTSLTTEMEQENEGEQEGRQILMESPYAYGLEVYDDVIEKIKADRTATEGEYEFFKTKKQEFIDLANDIKLEIETYEDKIDAIAQEKPGEAYSGPNAFWAVIAAALGAGASAMTGTPNFALQIMNKTIDDHLEKFKDDRDFKRKSIERQQLNLITERGRMLQMATNASDSALASLKNRAGMEAQIATVEGIKQEIMANREKNDQNLVLALKQLEYKKLAADASARREYGDAYVAGLGVTSIKDSQGIKDALKEGRALMKGVRSIESLREKALKIFDEVGKSGLIAQSAAGFGKAQGKDYIELRQLLGSMFGIYKNDIMKGGAALTPTEVIMITKVLPQESVSGVLLGEMETALRSLPKEYESRVIGFQQANQFFPVVPTDFFYQAPGKPEAQMPDRGRLPSAESLKGKSRKASG